MKRFTPPHEDPSSLDELLTGSQLAKRIPGRPHVSTVHRWASRGALVDGPDGPVRVLLPHRYANGKYLFTRKWFLLWVSVQTELRQGPNNAPANQGKAKRKRRRQQKQAPQPRGQAEVLARYGLSRDERG